MRKDICKDKDIRIRVTKYRLIHLRIYVKLGILE